MGGNSSKEQFRADMSAYEVACALDPDLQSLDATLQERTLRVISSFNSEVKEPGSISFDAISEIINCLLAMHQEVANFSLKCKEDIWSNSELFSFVVDYFAISSKISEFCIDLENCLMRARDKQKIILVAISHFEEEVEDGVDGVNYVKTLQELRKYKDAENPFTKEFFSKFKLVFDPLVGMYEKLHDQKRKLDRKLGNLRTWRRVSNVIFVTSFVSVLVLSVVAAAITAPPLVTALLGALTGSLGSVGGWCNSVWTPYEDGLKKQREVIIKMEDRTRITIVELGSIEKLARKLEDEIESMLPIVDIALREEDAVKLAMGEIKKKVEVFMNTIQKLSEEAGKCDRDIRRAKTIVLRTMFSQSE